MMAAIPVEPISERKALIEKHKNQKIIIPNLLLFLPGWRCKVNTHIQATEDDYLTWLNSLEMTEESRKPYRDANLPLFYAVCHPEASQERFLVLAKFICWWAIWDDEVDPGGRFADNRAAILESCRQLGKCIENCMKSSPNFSPPPDIHASVKILYPILADFRVYMGPVSANNFRRAFLDWIVSVTEQSEQLCQTGKILDLCDYLRLRTVNTGVRPSAILQEYVLGYELPWWVHEHDAIKAVTQECAKLTFLFNDILSLQKEFRNGQIENIVLLFAHHYDFNLDNAVGKVLETIQESFTLCTAAEANLPIPSGDAKLDAGILNYVQACKDGVVATVYWTYQIERYFKKVQVNGDMELELDLFVK